jgi:tetratricopeptide (TPR) repeat protein
LTLAASAALAEEKIFRKEVRQIVGTAQSQDDARNAAIAKAKRDALEEAGSWLQSISEVKNMQLVRDDVMTLSAGLTYTRVLEEEPFLEGRAVGIRVVAEVRVDNSGLAERAREFWADREQVAEHKAQTERERELLARLAQLEHRMAGLQGGSAEQQQALRAEVQENSRKLAAQEAYRKGEALWGRRGARDPQGALAAFSEAIRLDPGYAIAYARRGRAHTELKEYDKALKDINYALQLNPKLVLGYAGRARTYLGMDDPRRAIADASEALRFDPDFANAYHLRGMARRALGDRADARDDFRKACELGFDRACDKRVGRRR